MTKQNADLSQLLFFDIKITSKFNLTINKKKLHCRNNKRAFSKIECVEYGTSQIRSLLWAPALVFLLFCGKREARVGDS